MLYSIFVYDRNTRKLIWRKSLRNMLKFGNNDCFISFYHFIGNYHKIPDNYNKYLIALMKYLKFQKISVEIRFIDYLNIDMVVFFDKGDEQIIHNLFFPFIESECCDEFIFSNNGSNNRYIHDNFD